MDSKKVANLKRFWKEEGYEVQVLKDVSYYGKTVVVVASFNKEDGTEISFKEEWETMKSLAKRQSFYLLPVTESKSRIYGEVMFLSRHALYPMRDELNRMRREIEKSFWYLQGDSDVEDLHERIVDDAYTLFVLLRAVNNMNGTNDYAYLLEDAKITNSCISYMSSMLFTNDLLEEEEKISVQIDQEKIELYRYISEKMDYFV